MCDATIGRTYGRKRSDQIFAQKPCKAGAVHICTEVSKGATAPSWNQLRNAYEIGLPEFTHSVERFDRDGNFGCTASVIARLQGSFDDALVVTDRRFNFRAPVVPSRLSSVHPLVRVDRKNMVVSLGSRCRGRRPSHGSIACGHDEFSVWILDVSFCACNRLPLEANWRRA